LNDDFGDAVTLVGGSGSVAGSNVGATGETGEPLGSCSATDPQANSVWWSWTPTVAGSAQIDTNGSGFDTTLAVFTGSAIPTLAEVGCDDDDGDGLQSLLALDLVAGETYQIRVDGFGTAMGAVTLNYQQAAANQAPVVSAGPNQTVTLPADATLNGSVTDDGLPSGSLSSTWTKQSGPGTVTFGDTHAVDTTAGFSTAGVYVLRLTATDGALTTADDATITVHPQPPPPDYFVDDDDSVFEADINWMAAAGITKGCNPPTNTRYCPNANVTRGQMAAFLVRALGLTDRLADPFVDDDDSIFEADIERLAAARITRGCNPPTNNRFCPNAKVTRGQMAAFLVRALGYTDDGGGDLFVDDDDSIFETDIDRLGTAGVTKGCNPPANNRYCPDSFVTRGQMAAFLHRALG
jgi:hypothetical protein